MTAYLLWEYEIPKEDERNKKRIKLIEEAQPYIEKKRKEGVKWEILGLTDNTGRRLELHTFETMEDFEKIWNDEEFQKISTQYSRLVDNVSARILRPF